MNTHESNTWEILELLPPDAVLTPLHRVVQIDELQTQKNALEQQRDDAQTALQQLQDEIQNLRDEAYQEGFATGFHQFQELLATQARDFEQRTALQLDELQTRLLRNAAQLLGEQLLAQHAHFAELLTEIVRSHRPKLHEITVRIPPATALEDAIATQFEHAFGAHCTVHILPDPNLTHEVTIDHHAGRIVCSAETLLTTLHDSGTPPRPTRKVQP